MDTYSYSKLTSGVNLAQSNQNLLENYKWEDNLYDNILSFNSKNEESTYYLEEGRFSNNEESLKLSIPESRDFSYESKDLSAKSKDLPMFSFPPMKNYKNESDSQNIESLHHNVDSQIHQITDVPSPRDDEECKEDINSLLNCLTSIPHFKDQRFSTRRDVVNKSILRIMKRFYVTLFKSASKGKQRLNTVNEHLEISLQLLSSLKGYISVNSHLKYFITQMVSTKLTSKFEVDSDISSSLNLLNTCLYSYSDKALRRIFDDSSARLLFNYFYRNGQEFFMQQNNVKKNLSEYLAGLESIYKSFNIPILK